MKKLFAFLLCSSIVLFSGCGSSQELSKTPSAATLQPQEISQNSQLPKTSKEVKIRLTFRQEEAIVLMEDSKAAKDFLALLPLTLTMEDYQNTEKIAYLPRKLVIKDPPAGSDPKIGSFSYYAPWGDIAIFYQDYPYSNQLIPLGTVESGVEKLARTPGAFTLTIEKIESPD